MKTKPTVGQTLYSLNIGNAARRTEQKLTPVVVKSVGRKYFVCGVVGEDWRDAQFLLENWNEHTNYGPTRKLYLSQQEREDELESNRICEAIARAFEHGRNFRKLSLDKLRAIHTILQPQPPTE